MIHLRRLVVLLSFMIAIFGFAGCTKEEVVLSDNQNVLQSSSVEIAAEKNGTFLADSNSEASKECIEYLTQTLELKELPEIEFDSSIIDTYGYDISTSDLAAYAYGSILVGNSKNAETVLTSSKTNLQKYLRAISLIKYGRYSEAYDILIGLSGFLDSVSLYKQILVREKTDTYNDAIVLFREGNYQEAGKDFSSCTGYYDASDIVQKMLESGLFSYAIGSIGPAGGYIFYDKGSYSDGWRYLEAAPNDLSEPYKYGGNGITNTSTAVGKGKSNTESIVKRLGTGTYYAAKACSDYTYNGYDDWFLPSKDELNLMYTNLCNDGLGNFRNSYYWSSSEYSSGSAWKQYFSSGFQDSSYRDNFYYVRPIRRF